MQNVRNYIENDKGLEIFTIPNFLTDEECDHICNYIKSNHTKSAVVADGKEHSTYHAGRTSQTSTLPDNDIIISQVDQKMYDELGIEGKYSETTQGQLYEEGQFFNHHSDCFFGDGFNNHCLSSGQRTWTFMIYLNDVEEGGETDFPEIQQRFQPQKRMAVVWKSSNGKGTENPAALHAGMPVTKGEKMVITKWFRENEYNSVEDARLSEEYHNNQIQMPVINTFSKKEDLPKVSELGFKVVKVPPKAWGLIQDTYKLLQPLKQEENWGGISNFIHDINGNPSADIFNLDNCNNIKATIQDELHAIHEEFANQPLENVWIYGIRSYRTGSILEPHTDRIETHHVSSIVIVDKDLNCGCKVTKESPNDWALDIQDHQGNWHKIYAEIGDMILYESATCIHARMDPFKGNYFANMFVHYKLKNYTFVP